LEVSQAIKKIDELHFLLYERALHPELFHIHQTRRVKQRRYQAEIWVTGLSHVVSFQVGDSFATELTATDGEHNMLPKTGLVTEFRFRGERDDLQTFESGVRYIMSSQVERMTANLFAATHRDLVRHAGKRGIFRTFDDWTGEDGLQPFTFIDFEARDEEFHVHAFHAFPEDLTILKMQSIFEAPNARGR
jgi:hypothetical protein